MALSGEGAICIWNGITDEGRTEFYAWHNGEHMPERVGIPGFRRGRRYIAADAATSPEFFTLYELDSPQVFLGQDYLNRLNSPTPWTRHATAAFRDTSRALTRVHASFGPGPGGILATLMFAPSPDRRAELQDALAADLLPRLVLEPQVTGAHLCLTDVGASDVRTAESSDRTDIGAPPGAVVLIEGCNPEPVAAAAESCLAGLAGMAGGLPKLCLYRLEHTRLKTAGAPG
jgi:hypothetical protein